jgi:membrane associated rhomboid family serine protease
MDAGWLSLFDRLPQLLRAVLVVVGVSSTAFGLGFCTGRLLHDPHAAALAHASGACIALEMAAAHGAIDELERRMTLRALASALNPHFERFPERATEIASLCDTFTKGAVSGKVAR